MQGGANFGVEPTDHTARTFSESYDEHRFTSLIGNF
jgi:hypothetical protein